MDASRAIELFMLALNLIGLGVAFGVLRADVKWLKDELGAVKTKIYNGLSERVASHEARLDAIEDRN